MRPYLIWLVLLLSACASQQESRSSYTDANKQESARIHAELGSGYYQQNQMGIALEEFTKAIQFDESYSSGFNGLAMTYAAINEDVKAEDNFKKALALDPKSSEAHNNYGSFLCSRNRVDESISQFLEAVKNPLYVTPFIAYTNAGYCSLKKSDVSSAERYFSLALQYQPLLHNAAYQLAKIYFDRQQYGLARQTMVNALANNPSPEMLWLGVRIEHKLGNQDAKSSYALELRRNYPDSPQTQSLLAGRW
jgi:type IV pilus assembly protein PilF